MHIEVHGRGTPLVLIHGWAMHGGIFAPLLAPLAKRFEVHLVDLPGHGHSACDAAGFDVASCAGAIAAATPRALWAGWSLGGLVALQAALRVPAQVQAVALIATNPRFVLGADWSHAVAHDVFAQFATGLRQDWRRTLERFLALEAQGSERAQSELRALKSQLFERGDPSLEALQQGLQVLEQTDLRADLARLTRPSTWIAGRRDRLVPAAAMRWSATIATQADYVELSAGHAPFLGQPEAVADAIAALATRSA